MNTLSRTDLLATALILLSILLILVFTWFKNRKESLQNPEVYQGIDALMHRSSEEGKSLLIGLGEGFSGSGVGLGDLTGIMVERSLMNRVVFNDKPAQAFAADGALACISHLVVYGAYENALASELFRAEYNNLTGLAAFDGLAGLLPELTRAENAGIVLAGSFRPETFLIADLAERQNTPLMVASGSLPAQAAFFASSAEVSLGEDYYLPSVGKQDYAQKSMAVMNWMRFALTVGMLVAAILKLSRVLP